MAWKRLTIDDLRLVLAEDEIAKLAEMSLADDKLSVVIQQDLDMVADQFRGAWRSKGYNIDVRDHYVAPEYIQAILNVARWQTWTRFPMTDNYALSKPREKLFDAAMELLKDPYLGTSAPDYSDDPDLSASISANVDAAISMPWQKFPAVPFDEGFWQVRKWKFGTP